MPDKPDSSANRDTKNTTALPLTDEEAWDFSISLITLSQESEFTFLSEVDECEFDALESYSGFACSLDGQAQHVETTALDYDPESMMQDGLRRAEALTKVIKENLDRAADGRIVRKGQCSLRKSTSTLKNYFNIENRFNQPQLDELPLAESYFYSVKSALCFFALNKLLSAIQCHMNYEASKPTMFESYEIDTARVLQICNLLDDYIFISELAWDDRLALEIDPKKNFDKEIKRVRKKLRRSKKSKWKQCLMLPNDTYNQLWKKYGTNKDWGPVIAVMILFGVRSAEIENGISIGLSSEGLEARVESAKAAFHPGQKLTRTYAFSPTCEWSRLLYQIVDASQNKVVVVQRKAKSISDKFSKIYVLDDEGDEINVCPIMFRHIYVSWLQQSLSQAEVAAHAGHSSLTTQRYYGHRNLSCIRSQFAGVSLMARSSPNGRTPRKNIINHGLAKILARSKAKKLFGRSSNWPRLHNTFYNKTIGLLDTSTQSRPLLLELSTTETPRHSSYSPSAG